jgi:hypothetical protein
MYYAPVRRCTQGPKPPFSLDLHVLSTPPAFALSQDQTLQLNMERGKIFPQQNLRTSIYLCAGFLQIMEKETLLFSFQRTHFMLPPPPTEEAQPYPSRPLLRGERKAENFTLWGCVVRSLN